MDWQALRSRTVALTGQVIQKSDSLLKRVGEVVAVIVDNANFDRIHPEPVESLIRAPYRHIHQRTVVTLAHRIVHSPHRDGLRNVPRRRRKRQLRRPRQTNLIRQSRHRHHYVRVWQE